MKKQLIFTVSLLIFAFVCVAPPRAAVAWAPESHRVSSRIIVDNFPTKIKASVRKYNSEFYQGVEAEEELFDSVIEKNGSFSYNLFLQSGSQRMLYHLQRMQAMMAAANYGDALAFELGQFTRCAADLLEPLPDGKQFPSLEISGSRLFFITDFAKNNKTFDFLFNGRTIIQNFPATVDAISKINAASANKIYKIYHSKRDYRAVSNEAEASFNRALNFICDAMFTMENLVNTPHGSILDMHSVLGLDRFSRGDDEKIKKPKPPEPPKPPDPQKKNKQLTQPEKKNNG